MSDDETKKCVSILLRAKHLNITAMSLDDETLTLSLSATIQTATLNAPPTSSPLDNAVHTSGGSGADAPAAANDDRRYGEPQADIEWESSVEAALPDTPSPLTDVPAAKFAAPTESELPEPLAEITPDELPSDRHRPEESFAAAEDDSETSTETKPLADTSDDENSVGDAGVTMAEDDLAPVDELRYTCPSCATEGMSPLSELGGIVTCAACGQAMKLSAQSV